MFYTVSRVYMRETIAASSAPRKTFLHSCAEASYAVMGARRLSLRSERSRAGISQSWEGVRERRIREAVAVRWRQEAVLRHDCRHLGERRQHNRREGPVGERLGARLTAEWQPDK